MDANQSSVGKDRIKAILTNQDKKSKFTVEELNNLITNKQVFIYVFTPKTIMNAIDGIPVKSSDGKVTLIDKTTITKSFVFVFDEPSENGSPKGQGRAFLILSDSGGITGIGRYTYFPFNISAKIPFYNISFPFTPGTQEYNDMETYGIFYSAKDLISTSTKTGYVKNETIYNQHDLPSKAIEIAISLASERYNLFSKGATVTIAGGNVSRRRRNKNSKTKKQYKK
jgi:hypothetical protein